MNSADVMEPVAVTIQRAIDTAYADAELSPGASRSHITPLGALVRGQGIPAHELSGLCVRNAAKHFIRRGAHELLQGDETDPLAGYIYANHAGAWILVNADDPVTRRRFTVAHELGHYLLHFAPWLRDSGSALDSDDPDAATGTEFGELIPRGSRGEAEDEPKGTPLGRLLLAEGAGMAADADEIEGQADAFAAALLMPESVCRTLAQQLAPTYGRARTVLARRMASELLVSPSAMERRLVDLGIA